MSEATNLELALRDVLERSRELGFLGPGPADDQLAHAVSFAALVAAWGDEPAELIDLGSGGGVPALAILVRLRTVRVTLLEASARRCEFLRWALDRLDHRGRGSVLQGRAEELGRQSQYRERFDVVTARSFGPPAVTAECAAGFAKPGGALVTAEPPQPSDRWPATGLEQLGFAAADFVEGPPRFAIIRKLGVCPERFPRRTGIPTKRPLF